MAPDPAYRSRTAAPSTGPRMLKTFSRTRSNVGRVSRTRGPWIVCPLWEPAMIRMRQRLSRVVSGWRNARSPGHPAAGVEHAESAAIQRRRQHASITKLPVERAVRNGRRAQEPGRRLVVDPERAVVAARHERAAAEERHMLRGAVGCEQAPVGGDPAVDARRDPDAAARRETDVVGRELRLHAPLQARSPRIAYVDHRELRRRRAEPNPERPPVAREREVPGPEPELHPSDDLAAYDVDREELDTAGVGDEGVSAVARARGVPRLLEAVEHMVDAEPVEDAHRADSRVRHDGDAADTLNTSGSRACGNAVDDDAGTEIDDGDMRLGVRGHIGGDAAQRKRRRRGGEEEAAPVHTCDTSGERAGVRLGEQPVDGVLQRPRRRGELEGDRAGPLEQPPVVADVGEGKDGRPALPRPEPLPA